MKLKTKLRILALFLILVCSGNTEVSAQNREVRENLDTFTEIKTFNGLEVQVIPSEEDSIEITGHSREEVKFTIVDNRLEIRLSLDNIWSKDNTKIRVYAKDLRTIDANEGSIIEVEGSLKGRELTFRVQEGSSIQAVVNADKIVSKAVTGGTINLEGKAESQEVTVNTGGQFFGSELRTQETTVKAGTAARGEVYATKYVKATASLGGTIEIFGRPQEVDQKTSLGGRIL